MNKELLEALDLLEKEKNISYDEFVNNLQRL